MPKSIASIVVEYWELRSSLYYPPSTMGFDLENARTGLSDISTGYHTSDDDRETRYIGLVWLLRDLSETELKLLGALYCGVLGYEVYNRTVLRSDLRPLLVAFGDETAECLAELKNGSLCKRKRSQGIPRCRQHAHLVDAPATWITNDGDELVSVSELAENMAVVCGIRSRRPTVVELAEAMGIAKHVLKDLVQRAIVKIDSRLSHCNSSVESQS